MSTSKIDKNIFEVDECIGPSLSGLPNHFHSDIYEIYYLVKGNVGYFVSEKTYNVVEGDVIVIPPNTLHKTVPKNDQVRTRIIINLNKSFLKEFDSHDISLQNDVSIIHSDKDNRIGAIFRELLEEYKGKQNKTLLKALTCELVILLQREKNKKSKSIEGSATSQLISDVVIYINSYYNSKITLEKTAKMFFTNASYLSRTFKESTGISFSDYLVNFRIKKSLEMMEETDKNITQIAYDTGFGSTNHFCKAFKSVMGESPLQYRKKHFLKDTNKKNKKN